MAKQTTIEKFQKTLALIAEGTGIGAAIKKVGISPVVFYRMRKEFGGAPQGVVNTVPETAAPETGLQTFHQGVQIDTPAENTRPRTVTPLTDEQLDWVARITASGFDRAKKKYLVAIALR